MLSLTRQELKGCIGTVSLALIAYTALSQLMVSLMTLLFYHFDFSVFGPYQDQVEYWLYYLSDAIVFYPPGFLVFGVMLRSFPVPRIQKRDPDRPGQVLAVLGVALGLLYASSYLTQYFLADTGTTDYANQAIDSLPFGVALLTSVILAPVCEELIFRKLLLDRLLFLGDGVALALSSLFFGLFHTNLYQFLYAFSVGLVLGYVRIMTGRQRYNIGLHMFINLFCGLLISYLPQSGWIDGLLGSMILFCIIFSAFYLLTRRPWRSLYPGPTGLAAGEKVWACLTSVTFWICVLLHLGLSCYYIYL